MKKTITCSYTTDPVILVPDNPDLPNADFEFELVSSDHDAQVHYKSKYPGRWTRFFDTPRREYLKSRGCVCCDIIRSSYLCESCIAVEWEEYKQFNEDFDLSTWTYETERIPHIIPMRTYYWKQIGINVDSCFYEFDRQSNEEINFGETLLDRLNEGMEPMKRGRYITNAEDRNIISGSLKLRRESGTDGTTPHNSGNVLIGGVEYLYEDVF
jgi:hypothetical protein